jgi:LacI family transcriptional regulator
LRDHRRALLINDRPPASLEATVIDSVAVDDFAGGVMAAQYLARSHGGAGGFAVIGGPKADRRSQARIAGFISESPALVVHAKDWFEPAGEAAAERVLRRKLRGVFCCNDRLAEGFLRTCARASLTPPPLIGFDDAPIAARLGLTTVGIPWDALAAAITRLVRERLNGSDDPATHLVLFPRIVARMVRSRRADDHVR